MNVKRLHCWLLQFTFYSYSLATESTTVSPENGGRFDFNTTMERKLVHTITNSYRMQGIYGRPIRNASRAIRVEVALHLVQILDLDEHNQVLTVSMTNDFQWRDEIMVWNPEEWKGIQAIGISPDSIWTPDVIFSNSVAEEENIDHKFSVARVQYNGTVKWTQRKVFKTSCPIDMRNFPFDRQSCDLVVRSASYTKREVNLTSMNLTADEKGLEEKYFLDEYTNSSEWGVINVHKVMEEWANEDGMDILKYQLVLRRKLVFFTYILLLPCIFLTMLTMVIFWLPPERPDKTTLAMEIFASYTVLLLVLTESIPSTASRVPILAMSIFGSYTVLLLVLTGSIPSTASTVPILGMYYFMNMVLTAASIIIGTTVVNVARSNRSKPPVPKIIRIICIDTLAPIFGVAKRSTKSKVKERLKQKRAEKAELKRQSTLRKQANKENAQTQPANDLTVMQDKQGTIRVTTVNSGLLDRTQSTVEAHPFTPGSMDSTLDYIDETPNHRSGNNSYVSDSNRLTDNLPASQRETFDHFCFEVLLRIENITSLVREALHKLIDQTSNKDHRRELKDEKALEWHIVAVSIDRLFFFIYLGMIIILILVASALIFPRQF